MRRNDTVPFRGSDRYLTRSDYRCMWRMFRRHIIIGVLVVIGVLALLAYARAFAQVSAHAHEATEIQWACESVGVR
jgi:hypothetical protein